MPKRNWKPTSEDTLKKYFSYYPCTQECASRQRISELFGLSTENIDTEFRTNLSVVSPEKEMVNGAQMRSLISEMLIQFSNSMRNGIPDKFSILKNLLEKDPKKTIGLVFGAISDFCFNLEYIRRIKDKKWIYCSSHEKNRVFYPYLGVCPHCIMQSNKPTEAALGQGKKNTETTARYFGNKIESHHVGRIGERIIVYLLDLLAKSKFKESKTLLVFDDQHDVDAAFIFNNICILTQIKSSPLILLPVTSPLSSKLLTQEDNDTGIPTEAVNHSFIDFSTSERELSLYFSIDDSEIPLGQRDNINWPYQPFISNLDEDKVLKIISNWINIFLSFEIPKRKRTGSDIKNAYLTAGWGSPIDDNKAKPSLARSDNMMKGTYASLKYGAYYGKGCARKTIRSALIGNIDPAHQYDDYLKELEGIRWANQADFKNTDNPQTLSIEENKLIYLFDSVFTFNRQIMNDAHVDEIWNLMDFLSYLKSEKSINFLKDWSVIK